MRQRTAVFIAVAIVAFGISKTARATTELTGRQIMEKQKSLHRASSEWGLERMVLVDKSGNKETREMKRYAKEFEKDVFRGLAVFVGPADIKGTALLNWQHKGRSDDQWLFLPAQGKMQRVAEGGKTNYFMGTDFTYEDLQTDDVEAYQYDIEKEEKCGEYDCYLLRATPKTPEKKSETSYGKRMLWVRKDIFVTVKTEYFDKRDKLIKTQTAYDFENVRGSLWRAKKGIMDNHKMNHKTILVSMERKVGENISNDVFTERFVTSGKATE